MPSFADFLRKKLQEKQLGQDISLPKEPTHQDIPLPERPVQPENFASFLRKKLNLPKRQYEVPGTTEGVTIPITQPPVKEPRLPARPGYRYQEEPRVDLGPAYRHAPIPEPPKPREYIKATIPLIGEWAAEYYGELESIGKDIERGALDVDSFENISKMLLRDYTLGKTFAAVGGAIARRVGPKLNLLFKSKVWKNVAPETRKRIKSILFKKVEITESAKKLANKTSAFIQRKFGKRYEKLKLPPKVIEPSTVTGTNAEPILTNKGQIESSFYDEMMGKPSPTPSAVFITKEGLPIKQDIVSKIGKKEITAGARIDMQRLGNIIDDGPTGSFHDEIVTPMREIIINKDTYEAPLLNEMFSIAKQLGLDWKKHSQLVRQYGERKLTTEQLRTLPKNIRVGIKQMDRWFRRYYDNLRIETNKKLSSLNKPTIPYRSDYYRHIPELTMLQEKYGGIVNIPNRVLKWFGRPKPTTPAMKATLQRTGAIAEEDLQGSFEAFEDYIRLVSDTKFASDMTSKLRGYAKATSKSSPSISSILDNKADELSHVPLLNPKTELGKDIVSFAFKMQNRFIRNQIIGPFSVYVSQMLGVVQNAAIASEKQPIIGGAKAIVKYPLSFAQEMGESVYKTIMNPAYKSFAHKFSKVYQSRLATGVENIRLTTRGSTLQQFAAKVLNFTDRVQVSSMFNLTYNRAFKQTKSHELAIKIADDAASRAAAEFDKIMKPHLLNTAFGKLAMPITTIPVNNMNLIIEDIGKKLLTKGITNKATAISMAANMYGASIVANTATNLIMGQPKFTPMDLIPFYGPVKYGVGGVLRIPQTAMQIIDGKVNWWDASYRLAFSFLPNWGGAQLYKTTEGIKAIYRGGVETKAGKQKFPISGPLETGRALLFGPYGTKAGGEYLKGRKEKKKKKSLLKGFKLGAIATFGKLK